MVGAGYAFGIPLGPRCFPPKDIWWALNWALVAPGGWSAELVVSHDGDEYFAVTPPGSPNAEFLIDPEVDGTAALWQTSHYDRIEFFATLRDAVISLCALDRRRLHAVGILCDGLADVYDSPIRQIASTNQRRSKSRE